MGTSLLDTKRAEIVVGLLFIAIAAIVIRETIRLGAGWGASGPQPGFFPLIAAALVAAGAVIVIAVAIRSPGTQLFDGRDRMFSVMKVGAPLAVAVVSLEYLGFYLMTALYMAFFSSWYGRYRWPVVLTASLVLPVTLFFTFERGFRIALPKSLLYGSLLGF